MICAMAAPSLVANGYDNEAFQLLRKKVHEVGKSLNGFMILNYSMRKMLIICGKQ